MAIRVGQIIRASDIDGAIQTGTALLSFTDLDNYTQTVDFPATFEGVPNVHLNINSGAGPTARWQSRAIHVAAGGFTIFVFASEGGRTASWTDIAVGWTAIYRP